MPTKTTHAMDIFGFRCCASPAGYLMHIRHVKGSADPNAGRRISSSAAIHHYWQIKYMQCVQVVVSAGGFVLEMRVKMEQ